MLAHDWAVPPNITMTPYWAGKKEHGANWFNCFTKRHPQSSIRRPEATSLASTFSFNKHNVCMLFDKLSDVYDRCNFEASSVCNLNETEIITVQKPNRVVASEVMR